MNDRFHILRIIYIISERMIYSIIVRIKDIILSIISSFIKNDRYHHSKIAIIVWLQPMPEEEHNAPGFYYQVRWRRHDATSGAVEQYEDRAVDPSSSTLMVEGQPVYKPYEIYVLAINEIGEAVSPPKMVIGYSGENGWSCEFSCLILVCVSRLDVSLVVRILYHKFILSVV